MFEYASRMAATARRGGGFLARLFSDRRGNTLVIVGAAMIPLAAMIGSGVDMSRAYMAKTRLQSACDAAALAGRRVMTNDTISTAVQTEANRFFHFNFPKTTSAGVTRGPYQTAEIVNPTVTRAGPGIVRVTASTTIPTSVMRMFGFTTLPLSVTCDAALNFVNTDIMLVLDTTGSMNEDVNGDFTNDNSARKITALRDAVMALYDTLAPTQTQLEANGLRLRYGVVPYSSTVNVGRLISGAVPVPAGGGLPGNPDYLANDVDYQARVARYDVLTYVGTADPPSPPVTQVYGSSISQSDCDKYGRNVVFTGFTQSAESGGGPAPTPTWTRTFSNNEASGVDWGWSGAGDTSGTSRSCRRRYVETVTDTFETRYRWSGSSYEQESVDVSGFKMGTATQISGLGDTLSESDGNITNDGYVSTSGTYDARELAVATSGGNNVSSQFVTWNGCIEERETVSTITSGSGYTIPVDAYDLDINLIPSSDDTRWRPMWPQIVHRRTAGSTSATSGTQMSSLDSSYYACPTEARRLAAMNRGNMESYVQSLNPVGGTYHDIGMIWGARLLSSGGIFADSPDTFNSMPVSRHIIFMTDGQLAPNCNTYGAWGVEQNDTRVTGAGSCPNQYDRHMQRFKMVCNAAKSMGFSVWVIAFGTTLTTEMAECASNANQASTVANRDALIARFQEIGSNIGALRLTQ